MKTNMLAAAFAAMLMSGCSNPSTATSSTSSDKPSVSQKQDSDKNKTDKTTESEEELNDDIELENLSDVTGTEIDLSSAKGGQRITKSGTYQIKGTGSSVIVVDASGEDVTLDFAGATMSIKDGPAVYVRNAKNVTLTSSKASTISTDSHEDNTAKALDAAVYSRADLVIKGKENLTITDKDGFGIRTTGTLTCQDKPKLTINSGDVAMRAQKDLTIKNGTYTITGEDEGIESKAALLIENGTFNINTEDDCLNAKNDITIKNGTFTLNASGNDCIDSNGKLLIEGGNIQATALTIPECPFDTDDDTFKISGGTIVGVGATVTKPTDADQNTILAAVDSFTKLELKQDGKTLISYTMPEDVKASSSPKMPERPASDSNAADENPADKNGDKKAADKTGSESAVAKQMKTDTDTSATSNAENDNAPMDRPEDMVGMPGMGMGGMMNVTLSCKDLKAGSEAELYLDGEKVETFTVEEGLTIVGNISSMGGEGMPGGMNGEGMPEMPEMPQGEDGQTAPTGMPEDFDPSNRGERPQPPEGFENGERPEMTEGGRPGTQNGSNGTGSGDGTTTV